MIQNVNKTRIRLFLSGCMKLFMLKNVRQSALEFGFGTIWPVMCRKNPNKQKLLKTISGHYLETHGLMALKLRRCIGFGQ
jgi:hypothetical protein